MTTTRASFVERFGEDQAKAVEAAAATHVVDGMDPTRGSDPFRWAIVTCIGFECITREKFRTHHGITAPVDDLKVWIREKADLANHDGGQDWVSILAGAYNEYLAPGEN